MMFSLLPAASRHSRGNVLVRFEPGPVPPELALAEHADQGNRRDLGFRVVVRGG